MKIIGIRPTAFKGDSGPVSGKNFYVTYPLEKGVDANLKLQENAEKILPVFGGGDKIKRFLAQIRYLQFAVSGA